MPAVKGFKLTDQDIGILRYVYTYRHLQIHHLIALTARPHKRLHRRLLKLVAQRHIARVILPNERHIYVLGVAGVHALVEQGIAPKELIEFRLRHRELKPLFLKHTLMVVDVHVALELASRASDIKLVAWKQGQELFDSVRVESNAARETLPVRPDGFFTLEDTAAPAGKRLVHFFLEADRSTTTHQRFEKKVRGYWHYFNAGLHQKKYGIKSFRVATITLTNSRALSLCAAAGNILPQVAKKFYLFSCVKNFSSGKAQAIFGDIFACPHDGPLRHHRLIQPLPTSFSQPRN